MIQSTSSTNTQNPSTNSNTIGRRNSPPTNNSANNAQSTLHTISTPNAASAVPIQTFSSSVPFSLATATESSNNAGPAAIYALPSSMYQNVLPYPTPTTGFYQPLPHPQANTTIISSVIPHSSAHQSAAGTVPSTPHSFQAHSSGEITHFPFTQQTSNNNGGNSNNNNSTPQSTPSTPLSLTTVTTNLKNPPLFATPPIIPVATTTHIINYEDKKGGPRKNHNGGNMQQQSYSSHPKQSGSNMSNQRQGGSISGSGGYHPGLQNKKNSVVGNVTSNNNHNEDTNSSLSNNNMSNNYNANNRVKNTPNRDQGSGGYQPKPFFNKNQHQNSNSGSPNSNDNSEATNHSGKYLSRGPARIPPLDLKRNNSNASMVQNHHNSRSTPSTNSTESNNSPNSITSYDHSRTYQYSHHQQSSYGAPNGATSFYRGGSAGAISQNVHHNPNNNAVDSTQIQTCFPFNVHSQNPGSSTPLLDPCHPQALITYNNPMTPGMYVKFGQPFTFANVSLINLFITTKKTQKLSYFFYSLCRTAENLHRVI